MKINSTKSIDLVMHYMEIFYSGEDLDRLYEILAEDLIFEGPYYKFNSAKDYIDSLISSPPKDLCDAVDSIHWSTAPALRRVL